MCFTASFEIGDVIWGWPHRSFLKPGLISWYRIYSQLIVFASCQNYIFIVKSEEADIGNFVSVGVLILDAWSRQHDVYKLLLILRVCYQKSIGFFIWCPNKCGFIVHLHWWNGISGLQVEDLQIVWACDDSNCFLALDICFCVWNNHFLVFFHSYSFLIYLTYCNEGSVGFIFCARKTVCVPAINSWTEFAVHPLIAWLFWLLLIIWCRTFGFLDIWDFIRINWMLIPTKWQLTFIPISTRFINFLDLFRFRNMWLLLFLKFQFLENTVISLISGWLLFLFVFILVFGLIIGTFHFCWIL